MSDIQTLRCATIACVALTAASLLHAAEPPQAPEAAAMFERLLRRIPANTDPVELHHLVGQEFTAVIHAGNSQGQEVAIVPFVVAGRLYLIHCLRSDQSAITVYRSLSFNPDYEAQTAKGSELTKLRQRNLKIGFDQAADLITVLNANESTANLSFKPEVIFPIAKVTPKAGGRN